MDNLFFVEHFHPDKEAWANFMENWKNILSDEDMTVDKGMQYPDWEGNKVLLKCSDVTGTMSIGLWKLQSHATLDDFQQFMDRFIGGAASANKVYAVEKTLGAAKLDPRNFMRDFIHAAQGKDMPGYLDKPMFWMTRHQIKDKEGWESKVMEDMAVAIRKDCITPSDTAQLSPDGHGTSLVLFLSDDTCMCFDGSPAGMTKEDYQKFVDEFTKGTAENTVYHIDPNGCLNLMNLSEDTLNQDLLLWANSYVNPYAKTASHEDTSPVEASGIHLTSQ